MIKVLAAGSLKNAFTEIFSTIELADNAQNEIQVAYGPAGLLRERIENGESVDLFASASIVHPEILHQQGLCKEVIPFAYNKLCITTRVDNNPENWLALLSSPDTLIGTSTPGCDPSGDYTWALYDKLGERFPGMDEQLKKRSRMLVGGRGASSDAIQEMLAGNVDALIGYVTSARRATAYPALCLMDIPDEFNIKAIYAMALINENAGTLARSLCRTKAQTILQSHGFIACDSL